MAWLQHGRGAFIVNYDMLKDYVVCGCVPVEGLHPLKDSVGRRLEFDQLIVWHHSEKKAIVFRYPLLSC